MSWFLKVLPPPPDFSVPILHCFEVIRNMSYFYLFAYFYSATGARTRPPGSASRRSSVQSPPACLPTHPLSKLKAFYDLYMHLQWTSGQALDSNFLLSLQSKFCVTAHPISVSGVWLVSNTASINACFPSTLRNPPLFHWVHVGGHAPWCPPCFFSKDAGPPLVGLHSQGKREPFCETWQVYYLFLGRVQHFCLEKDWNRKICFL